MRPAGLVRRRRRLTPEVNSGYLPAVGRAPDVARGPRALKDGLPASFAAPATVFPPKNLEILSFDTTVRRRPDRSRPPQVGPKGHTCTESAARTAPAKHQKPCNLPLPDVASATRFAPTLPAEAALAARQKQGGRGELFPPHAFPVFPAFLPFCLFCLSSLPFNHRRPIGGSGVGVDQFSRWAWRKRLFERALKKSW